MLSCVELDRRLKEIHTIVTPGKSSDAKLIRLSLEHSPKRYKIKDRMVAVCTQIKIKAI